MTTRDALMGIDIGNTRTKAVVFDLEGRMLGMALDSTEPQHPRPLWAERDLEVMWDRTATVVRAALARVEDAVAVRGVGVSGHSDGLYVVDAEGAALRHAVLATDARARDYATNLATGEVGARLLELTGQVPMAASPAAILRWLSDREPDVLSRCRWLLSSTDWLRLRLTGTAATDLTMASAGFVALRSATWSEEVLELCTLGDVRPKLPPILPSEAVAGTVTATAAHQTGLPVGTPVVAGAHDVDTGALGMGTAVATLLLGTYAINQVLGDEPVLDRRWQTRPFLSTGRWLHMSTSAAGAGCLDWVAARIGPWNDAGAADLGAAVLEAEKVTASLDEPYFLPFVLGGPAQSPVGGGWLGVRAEHERASLLRSVLEGVAFSHRHHLRALASRMPLPGSIRTGGGGARSVGWSQLLADALGTTLEVTESDEVSALGAAMLAGLGIGAYADMDEAMAATVRVGRVHLPNAQQRALLDARYDRFSRAVETVAALELGPS